MTLLVATSQGCTPSSDVERYIHAVEHPLSTQACKGITDTALHGECLAMTAAAVAQEQGLHEARQRCADIPEDNLWFSECFFLISDAVHATADTARSLCDQAGIYRDRCAGHALQREGRPLLEATPWGQEAAIMAELMVLSQAYFTDERTGGQHVWHLLVEHIASRAYDAPFSVQQCGQTPRPLCVSAFITRMRFIDRDGLHSTSAVSTLCGQPGRTPVQAEALGLRGWTAESDAIAQEGLRRLCGPSMRYADPISETQ